MKLRLAISLILGVLGVEVLAQAPKEPVWVLQTPPFGAIATLAGFPDLRAVYPMAGPLVTDVRVGEVSPMVAQVLRFLRLTESAGAYKAAAYRWWVGNVGPYEPPASSLIQCNAPREGPRTCVLPVSPIPQQNWQSVLQKLLAAEPCPKLRATDGYELRVQVFEQLPYPRYREVEICDPMASEFRELFNRLVPSDFRVRE